MDDISEGREAESSDNVSENSLDLINEDHKSKLNRFHLSGVELDMQRFFSDLENQSILFNDDITNEPSVGSKHDDGSKVLRRLFDDGIIDGEYFSDDEEEEKDGDVATEWDTRLSHTPSPSNLTKLSRRFSTVSDIVEVNEDLEDNEISGRRSFQDSRLLVKFSSQHSRKRVRMTRSRSELVGRTTSTLEKRLRMIGSFKELLEERELLNIRNGYLCKKVCQFLAKTTSVKPFENSKGGSPTNTNQRYENVLEDFMTVQDHYETEKAILEEQNKRVTDSYANLCRKFYQGFENFVGRELEIGSSLTDNGIGKLGYKVASLTKKQRAKLEHLSKIRVSYLKLNNCLNSLNAEVRRVNNMGEGYTLMDYEQLAIVHNLLTDKMDERDEELRKFREECIHHISVLSQKKEALDDSTHETMSTTDQLNETLKIEQKARTLLAKERIKRDALRNDLSTSHQVAQLFVKPELLRKMAVDIQLLEMLKLKVEKLVDGDLTSIDVGNVVMPGK